MKLIHIRLLNLDTYSGIGQYFRSSIFFATFFFIKKNIYFFLFYTSCYNITNYNKILKVDLR